MTRSEQHLEELKQQLMAAGLTPNVTKIATKRNHKMLLRGQRTVN